MGITPVALFLSDFYQVSEFREMVDILVKRVDRFLFLSLCLDLFVRVAEGNDSSSLIVTVRELVQ